VTTLRFTRSGGLVAAPGLTVHARLELLDDGSGTVASAPGYRRRLSSDEGLTVLAAIDRLVESPGATSDGDSSRDCHRYEFEIRLANGGWQQLSVSGTPLSDSPRGAAVAELVDWARQESDAITSARFA